MNEPQQNRQPEIEWHWKPFHDLTATEVYDMLAARNAVFVVEQNCVYGDIDGLDANAWHLFAYEKGASDNKLAGYLRVLLPDQVETDIRIGRVLTTADFRGIGLGSAMLEQALKHIVAQWPDAAIRHAVLCCWPDSRNSSADANAWAGRPTDFSRPCNAMRIESSSSRMAINLVCSRMSMAPIYQYRQNRRNYALV